ncbi:hypothetical protein NDU88_001100 [Pleurodeles waltl]|uniref:Uncharacterized protein n=1 Tax=Pleurodeles waltl TaxID=8319 RepID=A0AAV7THT6_PLEWA|nr:hypothetical protein NDU88_001100 [Pleurodeles waltl]
MAAGSSNAAKDSGACGSGPPPKAAWSSSHGAGMQQPFHHASGCKMAAGGSNAAKESGACGLGPPRQREVRPVERECRDLFTVPPGTKWQPAALMPQRRLGLVVRASQAA